MRFDDLRTGWRFWLLVSGVCALSLLGGSRAQAGPVLDTVKARGTLHCGVSEGIPGFSMAHDGLWKGLDVDYCRALASALFADADAVKYVPLTVKKRFEALRSGQVDVLARNSTWTLAREAEFGIAFAGILFFDGQGFLTRREDGARYALELGGSKVCVKPDTTTALNIENYFALNAMEYTQVPVEDFDAMKKAFESGACDVVSSDQSQLFALRAGLEDPANARVLPEFISKEPLSPAVVASDTQWLLLARLVLALLINAEEMGIHSGNVGQIADIARSAPVRGLLDLDGRFARHLGLRPGWAPQVLAAVGNYGELFNRNLGKGSQLGLKRGQNALWNRGGLLYAPRID